MMSKKPDHAALFNAMPIPRFIVGPDDEGGFVVIEANRKALEYFDRSDRQILGYPIHHFMDNENARHFQQSFEVCVSRQKPVTIQALPTIPGSRIRVQGFWINPVIDNYGRIQYLDIIGQPDVTDQSILQRERDDAISLLTSVFDVSEVGIVVTDNSGKVVRVNDSFVRTYGWSRDELINADITSLVTPDERERARSNHEKFIRNGGRTTGEMKIIRKDGSVANALFTTATLELSQKRRYQVTTVMDITLRKQMEQHLRLAKEQADAANMAKSTFLANMSHELRTPMNAIIGFSEMMMKETFGPLGSPKYGEYLTDIHASAEHLLEIINEVLDMSKIEAGRIELDEGEVDMRGLVESVTRMLASRAFGNNMTINLDIGENLPHLHGDQRLIRQILINLVTNALKFSHPGGRIDVSAKIIADGRMEIIIADQGVGIPRDKIREAMEPFGQVNDRAEKRTYYSQGTGLGLPLAKAMAELHDGTLRLDSDTGQGTRVFVHFPTYRVIAATGKVNLAYKTEQV